jgi:hypothetical protein
MAIFFSRLAWHQFKAAADDGAQVSFTLSLNEDIFLLRCRQ